MNYTINKTIANVKKDIKGFSLIELMIVVAVIAILAVVGVTVFSGVQRNARDSRRKADVDAIVKALEATKVANSANYSAITAANFAGGSFPTDTSTQQYCITMGTTAFSATPSAATWTVACPGGSPTYSPVHSATYGTFSTFQVCAYLENGPSTYCKNNAQ